MSDGADYVPMSPRARARKAAPERPARARRWAALGVWLAVMVALGVAALNLFVTDRTPAVLGLLAVVPFLAASLSGVTGTFVSGGVAVGIAVMVGDYDNAVWTRDLVVIVSGVAAATVTATLFAAVKLRRVRQLRNTRAVADVVQQTLLRPVPPTVDQVTVAARYASATRGAQVGGDIYEVLSTPYGLRAFIADVKGKGLPAVHLASVTLGAFREWCYQAPTLAALAEQLDASIARNAGPEEFVTAVLVQIDGADMEIVNCGHPAPLLLTGAGVTPVDPPAVSLPLGLGVTATPQRLTFTASDRLLLFTDGVSEARRRDRFFDVAAELQSAATAEADELVRRLHRRLEKFTRRRLTDDISMLLLQGYADTRDPQRRADDPGTIIAV